MKRDCHLNDAAPSILIQVSCAALSKLLSSDNFPRGSKHGRQSQSERFVGHHLKQRSGLLIVSRLSGMVCIPFVGTSRIYHIDWLGSPTVHSMNG